MELKRAIKKLPSEQNLRLLSSLIISLANKVDSTSEKCINPFTPNTAYAKGSYVTHDNYIYESKIACNDADWVESHWVRLSDTIEELSVDTVKSWLNLSSEELANLQSLIDDTAITTTKTNSSSKIYMDIQAAIAECKNDTLKQIAKKVSGSYKIASSTSEVTSADFIYLINNGVNYDLYVLVDSVPTRVGDTSVNFDNYYTKTEVDSDFLKKTDATSTYATITTVDGKVDKTDIATTINSSSTNEKVAGAKAVYKELSKKVDAVSITVTTMDELCALVDSEGYSWLIPKLGFIAWDNPIAPDMNNTYLVLSKQQVHAFTYIGNMYVLDYANKKWKSVSSTSNPNLLDNPWFTVNQRGATTYDASTGTKVYTVDRWQLPSGTLKVISDGVSITRGTGGNGYILQPLESVYNQELVGKTVTMSVKTTDGNIYAKTFTIKNDNYYEMVLTTGINIGYNFTASIPHILIVNSVEGTTINIRAVKLELGSVSTLHLDSAPNYATELVKCQRYYVNYTDLLLPVVANRSGSNLLFAPITFPNNINKISGIINAANYNINYINLNGTKIDKTTISSLGIYGVNNNTGYIQIELTSNITSVPSSGLIHFGRLEISADL